jgi:ribosomal-protein-alanine N-acetyltransferase
MSAILKDPLLKLRPMHESDLEAVAAVERESYQFPWSQGIFRDCLRVGYCCWVCTRDTRVIGYGVMSVAVGESHVLNVCVHPDVQGQGVGRKLMERLLSLARSHSADTAYLEVRPSNRPALALYRSLGFSQVGVRRAYYPAGAGREDALILALTL